MRRIISGTLPSTAQDAILSYEFLRRHRVAIFPHENCLVFPDSSVVKGIAEKPNSARKVVSFAGVDNGISDVPPLCPIVANSVTTSTAISGCFVVPEEWVERICEFAGFRPELDAFASAKSRRFERCWDKHWTLFGKCETL